MKSTQAQLSKEQFPRSKQSRGSEIPPPQEGVNMSTEFIEDVKIDEKIKNQILEPANYKVIMLNDDSTPMDFVTSILTLIFKHSEETAKKVMLTIHDEGSAVVGIYKYEIAEQKALEATTLSRDNGFPLQLRLEQE